MGPIFLTIFAQFLTLKAEYVKFDLLFWSYLINFIPHTLIIFLAVNTAK